MTWKGIKPLVNLVEGTYEKGVKVLAKELEQLQPFKANILEYLSSAELVNKKTLMAYLMSFFQASIVYDGHHSIRWSNSNIQANGLKCD